MMEKLLLMLCMLVGHGIHAQTIERHTFANAGGVLNTDGTYWQFTVGEPIIGLTGAGPSLDQGFWAILGPQYTLSNDPISLQSPEISVYPNPVSDHLTIKINQDSALKVAIHNVLHQKVLEANLRSSESYATINLSTLSSGTYYVTLSIPELQIKKTIKIIKN